ncbi:hypothetical protein FRX31_015394 [Thalictrum thalictroides]|uniref:F-box domain-containing protein n=1 Tax=Thalictrum thalictroides TaxID=46969 RepID=A0A7J6WDN0_THATH|nr:hypothetical protein FRX31_015394 [Thalictrum thalictroides]
MASPVAAQLEYCKAAANISDLDEDLMLEIISRLVIKHMVSCKSVSKLWYRLISDVCIPRITTLSPVSSIIYNVLPLGETDQIGPWSFESIAKSTSTTTYLEDCFIGNNTLPFRPSPNDFLDCCNGLLLFVDPSSRQYYVCNPSTQQYHVFPEPPFDDSPKCGGALMFEPDSPNVSEPGYKVVTISRSPPRFYFFSLSFLPGGWYVYTLCFEPAILEASWNPRYVCFNGILHCLSVSGHLLKFNVKGLLSCFKATKLPEIVSRDLPIGCLGVSCGNLHYSRSDQSSMMVWMLKVESADEWVLKHTICLQIFDQHPLCSNLLGSSWFSVFAFHPSSDMLIIGAENGIFCYDPNTKRLERSCSLRENKSICNGNHLVFPYSIKLTPLDASVQRMIDERRNNW